MKATIGDWSKLKAKCYWHGAATDIQDEVSHLDENSVKFGNKEIYSALAKFLVLIIEHTEGLFKSATERLPNFPILSLLWKGVPSWRWQIFEVNVRKIFPTHSALSPGLMVMTCACPRKVVYGISLMTSGESPQMILDVIMSRFPPDYSPNIIYDNACKRVRKILSCPSASLNWNVFANPESFCWLPRRGSSLFEIIWMISHRTYFPLFPSLFFVSSAKLYSPFVILFFIPF